MDSRDKLRAFARRVSEVACELAIVRDPRFDERRSRIIDGAIAIDLLNPLHVVSWRVDVEHSVLVDLLQPTLLGTAGWLGRIDVVRTMLAAGVDPAAPDRDGITPIDRTICAWVTTDLHVACVEAMLDAGATPLPSHGASLRCEAVGDPAGIAIAELLARRATRAELRAEFASIAEVLRENAVPGMPLD
ncbi:MAG: hypothetical protein HOV81_17250 [Kofleriaceae bacterium]|nr:hypothetical protein [Kofleriaceae bacterium]